MPAVKKGKPGRPKVKDKVKVRSAYLTDTENKSIVSKFGSITKAIRANVLPVCG